MTPIFCISVNTVDNKGPVKESPFTCIHVVPGTVDGGNYLIDSLTVLCVYVFENLNCMTFNYTGIFS